MDDLISSAASVSSLLVAGWGRSLVTRAASPSSPTSEGGEEGREGGVMLPVLLPGRRGWRLARSPGAGEEGPTSTQSWRMGLSLLGGGEDTDTASSSPQIMEEIEENMTEVCGGETLLWSGDTQSDVCP